MWWNYRAYTLVICSCMATPTPPGFVGHKMHLQTELHLLSQYNVGTILLSCSASVTDLCIPSNPLPKQPVSLYQLGEVLNSHSYKQSSSCVIGG